MGLNRLNPVMIVTGATSPVGAACLRALAGEAHGGLILVDAHEAALDAAANALEAPPERVSTLALDPADPARWGQAREFIAAHYGRLDFALLNMIDGAAVLSDRRLKSRGRGADADLDVAGLSLRALMALMRSNSLGGGAVIIASADTLRDDGGGLTAFMRAAAKDASVDAVSVNAIAVGASGAAVVRRAPLLSDLASEAGGEAMALERIARQPTPLARTGEDDVGRLAELLLAAPVSGLILVMDASPAL